MDVQTSLPSPQDFTHQQVALATGCNPSNVAQVWPCLLKALLDQGIPSRSTQVSLAGTVAVETGSFLPIKERLCNPSKNPKIYAQQMKYWGTNFMGRGLIQLTHEENYLLCGKALGIDLIKNPDLLLDLEVSAKAAVWYFKTHHLDDLSLLADWHKIRVRVNGGDNGMGKFLAICKAFQ